MKEKIDNKDIYGLVASILFLVEPITYIMVLGPVILLNTIFNDFINYGTLFIEWILLILTTITILSKKYKNIKYCIIGFIVLQIYSIIIGIPNLSNVLDIFRHSIYYILWIYLTKKRKVIKISDSNKLTRIDNMKLMGIVLFIVMIYARKYMFLKGDIFLILTVLINEIGFLFFSFFLDELRINNIEL